MGLIDTAKKMVVESFSVNDQNSRFHAFWGLNYDWSPEQDYGCVAMIALQRMIVQYEDNKVYLLPSWPKEWDVRFKVNGPNQSTLEGVFENGKLTSLNSPQENKIVVVNKSN